MKRRSQLFRGRPLGAVVGLSIGVWLWAIPSFAAEQAVLRYGPFARSLPVRDLRQLADTGKRTRQLRSYLRLVNQDARKVQTLLNHRLSSVNVVKLDRFLNSVAGNLLLDEIGEVIHSPSGRGDRQALRSALILDASVDQQITIIDTLENYPTNEIEVEGRYLERVIKAFNKYQDDLN